MEAYRRCQRFSALRIWSAYPTVLERYLTVPSEDDAHVGSRGQFESESRPFAKSYANRTVPLGTYTVKCFSIASVRPSASETTSITVYVPGSS